MGEVKFTPGPVVYLCKRCGWSGEVKSRPRCLPCYAKHSAKWRAANPDKNREMKRRADKKLRTERPDVAAAKTRAKRKRNPEHYRAKWAERAKWLKAGDVTKDELEAIYIEADGKCHYCGSVVNVRLRPDDPRGFDHVIPRSKCGRHTASNIVVCCGPCNARKSDHE